MKKTNNKGFSLVELIVVIAIMAVLVVVLAPQFTKYVERGRNSTDRQNATAIVTAVQVWASETDIVTPDVALGEDATGTTITVEPTGGSIGTGANAGAIEDALLNAGITIADVNCVSQTAWPEYEITFTVTDEGVVDYTTVPTDLLQ